MRSVLKWLGIGVGSLIVLALVGLGLTITVAKRALARSYSIEVESVSIATDPEEIEEGRRLYAARGCAECHAADLGGKAAVDDPALGMVWGANLTKGKGGVVSSYQDRDWVRAVRHGVKPDGLPVLMMPSEEFYHLSDRELGALVGFLRSAPTVDREPRPHEIKPLMYVLGALGLFPFDSASVIDHAAKRSEAPEPAVTPAFGEYLAKIQCVGCHGAGLGGGPLPGAPPSLPTPANLTSDPTGLGGWSQAEFERAMRTGKRPDGRELNPFMPWQTYRHLNDTELGALWAYLRSIPAKPHGSR